MMGETPKLINKRMPATADNRVLEVDTQRLRPSFGLERYLKVWPKQLLQRRNTD
jgi:hypothetical protein